MRNSMDTTKAMIEELTQLLKLRSEAGLEVKKRADALRKEVFGDAVHLRGIIEISNRCVKNCSYCGIRAGNSAVKRYTMTEDEILVAAKTAAISGCKTVVLQSGEPPATGDAGLERIIGRIADETGLAITVSCGIRSRDVYASWKVAGMDRYLLRFETSDPELYRSLHPDSALADRIRALDDLRGLGVQLGSGFLIGIPGESIEVIAKNILLCQKLNLGMIGVGPFIPHPETPFSKTNNTWASDPEMYFMTIAVLRLYNPKAYIPATTAYDALFPDDGREKLLSAGANVFMPNYTPLSYRTDYHLYPGKADANREAELGLDCVRLRIEGIGRVIATDRGDVLETN